MSLLVYVSKQARGLFTPRIPGVESRPGWFRSSGGDDSDSVKVEFQDAVVVGREGGGESRADLRELFENFVEWGSDDSYGFDAEALNGILGVVFRGFIDFVEDQSEC
jgi:hypothetical protein